MPSPRHPATSSLARLCSEAQKCFSLLSSSPGCRWACKRPSTVGSQSPTGSWLAQPQLATYWASVSSSVKRQGGERCPWPSFGGRPKIQGFTAAPPGAGQACGRGAAHTRHARLPTGSSCALQRAPQPARPRRPQDGLLQGQHQTCRPSPGLGPELGQDPETEAVMRADALGSPSEAVEAARWDGPARLPGSLSPRERATPLSPNGPHRPGLDAALT